ncbi:hypothetical protein [Flavobacterium sp. N502540]|uniref:hypothetical protein n=1 Tax=Flavobacterium sp. N502540 TaxID=2986838 RepID=UPI002225B3F5|nr:hypothetical protein [Flavobacterium sp. N502540]
MKNVNYVLGNCKKLSGIKFILSMMVLLSVNFGYSQSQYYSYYTLFRDAKDDYTKSDSWVFSIDDDVSSPNKPGAFSWFSNGGRNLDDLMMTLTKRWPEINRFELRMQGSVVVQNFNNKDAHWDNLTMWADNTKSYIQSNGDDDGLLISSNTGNKISLGDGNDEVAINSKKLILDYGGTNDLAQVAINAGNPVNGAALTVGGMTYIGNSKSIESNPGISNDLKEDCSLFVEKQILASDLNIIPKQYWMDSVFESDYKKMDLDTLEGYVKENKHLPGIVSEKEVNEKGYKIHDFNVGLLQNVEELLLHIIDQNKKNEALSKKIEVLTRKIEVLESQSSQHK